MRSGLAVLVALMMLLVPALGAGSSTAATTTPHVVVAAEARTPGQLAADAARTDGRTGGAAADFQVGDHTFVAISGSPTAIRPEVQDALDSVPENLRPKWHGGCAEPRCVSQALEAGLDPTTGRMTAYQIGDVNPQVPHGGVRPACPSCEVLRDRFGYDQ